MHHLRGPPVQHLVEFGEVDELFFCLTKQKKGRKTQVFFLSLSSLVKPRFVQQKNALCLSLTGGDVLLLGAHGVLRLPDHGRRGLRADLPLGREALGARGE